MHTGLGSRVVGLTGLTLGTVDRADVDDAAPALFHHIAHHLLGDVEHGVQVGLDHLLPVIGRHFDEHAVTCNACVVHQHIDIAALGLGTIECLDGGIPVADITCRRIEGITQSFLLLKPLLEIARWATSCDDLEAIFV